MEVTLTTGDPFSGASDNRHLRCSFLPSDAVLHYAHRVGNEALHRHLAEALPWRVAFQCIAVRGMSIRHIRKSRDQMGGLTGKVAVAAEQKAAKASQSKVIRQIVTQRGCGDLTDIAFNRVSLRSADDPS